MLEKLQGLNNEKYQDLVDNISYLLNEITDQNYSVDYWFNYDNVPEEVVISTCNTYGIDLEKLVGDLESKSRIDFLQESSMSKYSK